jgi:predicted DCC family thiol-disulfide oxidoreductase YuxK
MATTSAPAIVYFDGVCGLCNRFVDFVLRHDPEGRFRFAALQSPRGEAALRRIGADPGGPLGSVIVEDAGDVLVRSDAVLRVWRRLGFPFSLLAAFRIVPRPLRDAVYSFIARRRYAWFGKRETCRVPTPAERARFLD